MEEMIIVGFKVVGFTLLFGAIVVGLGWLVYLGYKLVRKGIKYDSDIDSKNDDIIHWQTNYNRSDRWSKEDRQEAIKLRKKLISTQKDLGMLRCEFEDGNSIHTGKYQMEIVVLKNRIEDLQGKIRSKGFTYDKDIQDTRDEFKEEIKRLRQKELCQVFDYQDLEAKYKDIQDKNEDFNKAYGLGTPKEVQTLKEEIKNLIKSGAQDSDKMVYWQFQYGEFKKDNIRLQDRVKELNLVVGQCNENDNCLNEEIEELKESITSWSDAYKRIAGKLQEVGKENKSLKDEKDEIINLNKESDYILSYWKGRYEEGIKDYDKLAIKNNELRKKISWFTVESAKITDTVKSLGSENLELHQVSRKYDLSLYREKELQNVCKELKEQIRSLEQKNKCNSTYPEVIVCSVKCTKCNRIFKHENR